MKTNQWKIKQQFILKPLSCLTGLSLGFNFGILLIFLKAFHKKVDILAKWDPHNEPEDPNSVPGFYAGMFGSRFFGGQPGSSIKIHGRKMERTWTLLSADAQQGSNTLRTRDDPTLMGWRVGDTIGLAKTTTGDVGRGQQTKIVEIQPFKIIVEDGMEALRWGGVRNVEGYQIEMATEVINLR